MLSLGKSQQHLLRLTLLLLAYWQTIIDLFHLHTVLIFISPLLSSNNSVAFFVSFTVSDLWRVSNDCRSWWHLPQRSSLFIDYNDVLIICLIAHLILLLLTFSLFVRVSMFHLFWPIFWHTNCNGICNVTNNIYFWLINCNLSRHFYQIVLRFNFTPSLLHFLKIPIAAALCSFFPSTLLPYSG